MIRNLIFLICLPICISCNSHFISLASDDKSIYCGILHLPDDTKIYFPSKPYIGIIMKSVTPEDSGYDCDKFVQVDEVIDGSPAMKAGLKEGDVILSVNKTPVCAKNNDEDPFILFKRMIEGQKADSLVKINIMRSGRKIDISAGLMNRVIRRQPEAAHSPALCMDRSSLLMQKLKKQDKLSLFYEITSGLDIQTNSVHNPKWLTHKIDNPYQLKEFTYMLRHPLRSGEVADELTRRLINVSDDKDLKIAKLVNELARMLDIDNISTQCADLTFPKLIGTLEDTYQRINTVLQRLTPEEKALLYEKALEPWDSDQWNTILDLSLKIDLRELINAFNPLLSCLTNDNLARLRSDLSERFKNVTDQILYEAKTSFGKVIVGGEGPNIFTEDAALILDLGGNDIYLNNAGGTRPGMPVALVIDWGGNDYYMSKENFSQGAGILGGGFLIDLDGNDTFIATDGSQGTGIYGIGLLFHSGGKTILRSRSFSQGVGQLGIGLLWNRDKDSIYECGKYGQALGLFGGAGVLIDEDGNDRYILGGFEPDFRDPAHSTVSMGQGFGKGIMPQKNMKGVSGGIGILIDKKGDDAYIADYFAQGSSYYYGVGILDDLSGNDRYIAGRYTQGAGIHSSVGVLIDQKGNDLYYASYGVAQGMGHDYGVGFLEDRNGNDRYMGSILSQGAATHGGIGIILDLQGDDFYSIKGNGQAYAHDRSCMGIMVDMEPVKDSVSNRRDALKIRIDGK